MSELVETGSTLGQIEPNVPRNTKIPRKESSKSRCPDLPILAFFVFPAFFILQFSLLFCVFLLSFPRILRVQQRRKSSFFSGDPLFFAAKKQGLEGQGIFIDKERLHGGTPKERRQKVAQAKESLRLLLWKRKAATGPESRITYLTQKRLTLRIF